MTGDLIERAGRALAAALDAYIGLDPTIQRLQTRPPIRPEQLADQFVWPQPVPQPVTRPERTPMALDCPTCNGTGDLGCPAWFVCGDCTPATRAECASCGGTGRVTCTRCGGSGSVRCTACGGSGRSQA